MALQHASISNCWSSCVWVELDKLLTTWEFNNPIHGDSDDWTQEVVKVPWLLKWGMCPYSFHKPWGVVILLGPQRHRRHRPCAVRSMLTWLQLRLYLPLNWVNPWTCGRGRWGYKFYTIWMDELKPGAFGCEERGSSAFKETLFYMLT